MSRKTGVTLDERLTLRIAKIHQKKLRGISTAIGCTDGETVRRLIESAQIVTIKKNDVTAVVERN